MFEMGTGVSPPLSSPGNLITYLIVRLLTHRLRYRDGDDVSPSVDGSKVTDLSIDAPGKLITYLVFLTLIFADYYDFL